MSKRTFTFNPTLNTSIRGHGKWGDFLVALIPLSWCGNILVNSNFILRMIEWQNESSLFTIRVQGKQWYWVYKFDANAAQNINSAPKNIGHNRWFITTPLESYCADTYYQALTLGTQLEFRSLYYKYLTDDSLTQSTLNLDSLQTNSEFFTYNKLTHNFQAKLPNRVDIYNLRCFQPYFNIKHYGLKSFTKLNSLDFSNYLNLNKEHSITNLVRELLFINHSNSLDLKKLTSFYDFDQLDDLSNFAANVAQKNSIQPLLIVRGILNKHNIEILRDVNNSNLEFSSELKSALFLSLKKKLKKLESIPFYRQKTLTTKEYKRLANTREAVYPYLRKINKITKTQELLTSKLEKKSLTIIREKYKNFINMLLRINYKNINLNNNILPLKPIFFNILFQSNSGVVDKIEDAELLWGFRQKKYKRFKKFFFNQGFTYNSKTFEVISPKKISRQFNNNIVDEVKGDINYHDSIKYNRHRHEMVPVNLARRLLRVKRTLVLPAHVNITLISNSYDVVHSWFIPGLGIKIDCVPGRSTHHTFYIDNVGFYYGQCAEICGRYHHHMPIRLCALPFEHFLVWWQKKGLQRLHRLVNLRQINSKKLAILNSTTGSSIN